MNPYQINTIKGKFIYLTNIFWLFKKTFSNVIQLHLYLFSLKDVLRVNILATTTSIFMLCSASLDFVLS